MLDQYDVVIHLTLFGIGDDIGILLPCVSRNSEKTLFCALSGKTYYT